jgi:hypothetical protein
MKYIFFIIFISLFYLSGIESMYGGSYSEDRLISARARWIGNESCLNEFKCNATMHANNILSPTVFFLNKKHFVAFDAQMQRIKTFIEQGNFVDLEYDEFSKFIKDPDLLKKARAYSIE